MKYNTNQKNDAEAMKELNLDLIKQIADLRKEHNELKEATLSLLVDKDKVDKENEGLKNELDKFQKLFDDDQKEFQESWLRQFGYKEGTTFETLLGDALILRRTHNANDHKTFKEWWKSSKRQLYRPDDVALEEFAKEVWEAAQKHI